MKSLLYIFCFTLLALLTPRLSLACSEHKEKPKTETKCDIEDNNHHNSTNCCEKGNHSHNNNSNENNSCNGKSDCCCPIMVNHSCCLYINPIFSFNFNIPQIKEEISTIIIFQEASGFSSIFIPPKLG